MKKRKKTRIPGRQNSAATQSPPRKSNGVVEELKGSTFFEAYNFAKDYSVIMYNHENNSFITYPVDMTVIGGDFDEGTEEEYLFAEAVCILFQFQHHIHPAINRDLIDRLIDARNRLANSTYLSFGVVEKSKAYDFMDKINGTTPEDYRILMSSVFKNNPLMCSWLTIEDSEEKLKYRVN